MLAPSTNSSEAAFEPLQLCNAVATWPRQLAAFHRNLANQPERGRALQLSLIEQLFVYHRSHI